MVQIPSWEANRSAASQEIPRLFMEPEGSLPHSQVLATSWRSILILFSHLRLGLLSDLFPSGFPTKILYTRLISPICATCPAHLILLDLITRTI